MPTFRSRLTFLVLISIVLSLVWGCSQTDDITARKSLTNVWLTAERLPSPPDSMVYELWAAKNTVTGYSIPANEVSSLGRFSYINNDSITAYLEPGSLTKRADSNLFSLDDDLFSFSALFVSIERLNDPSPQLPGPIMLIQPISGETDTLRMLFPFSSILQEETIVRYNMEGVTDGSRNLNDGYGVWFTAYVPTTITNTDSLSITAVFTEDTIAPIIDINGDTTNLAAIHNPENVDSVIFTTDTILVEYGIDTVYLDTTSANNPLTHIRTTWKTYKSSDISFPFVIRDASLNSVRDSQFVNLEVFFQDQFNLPDYSDWGWDYQGWILSDHLSNTIIGGFTPPAWNFKFGGENLFPGDEGGLLTTGKFSKIAQSDDSDPYTFMNFERVLENGDTLYKKPQYPGEDFLDTAALNAAGIPLNSSRGVDLLPAPNPSSYGSVFISLEPRNDASDTTNFPLIPYMHSFPDNNNSTIKMQNWTKTISGTPGFPVVTARIQRL